MRPPIIVLRPPRNPCSSVGERTTMPRTTPRQVTTRAPGNSKVVVTGSEVRDTAIRTALAQLPERNEPGT